VNTPEKAINKLKKLILKTSVRCQTDGVGKGKKKTPEDNLLLLLLFLFLFSGKWIDGLGWQ